MGRSRIHERWWGRTRLPQVPSIQYHLTEQNTVELVHPSAQEPYWRIEGTFVVRCSDGMPFAGIHLIDGVETIVLNGSLGTRVPVTRVA